MRWEGGRAGCSLAPALSCIDLETDHTPSAAFSFHFQSSIISFPFFFFKLFLYGCAGTFSSCSEQRLFFIAVHRLLIVVASLVAEYGLWVHGFQ